MSCGEALVVFSREEDREFCLRRFVGPSQIADSIMAWGKVRSPPKKCCFVFYGNLMISASTNGHTKKKSLPKMFGRCVHNLFLFVSVCVPKTRFLLKFCFRSFPPPSTFSSFHLQHFAVKKHLGGDSSPGDAKWLQSGGGGVVAGGEIPWGYTEPEVCSPWFAWRINLSLNKGDEPNLETHHFQVPCSTLGRYTLKVSQLVCCSQPVSGQ